MSLSISSAPTPPTWLLHLIINTLGPIFVFKALYPLLLKGKEKTVVFISSITASLSTFPFEFSLGPYGQSKVAINHTARSLAAELANEGCKLVLKHPGKIDTDMLAAHIRRPASLILVSRMPLNTFP